jgi:transposase
MRLRKDDDPMGKPPRKHSREFKIEAVKQVVEQGRTLAAVADGLGLNANLLSRWKRQFEEEGVVAFPGKGRQNETDAEITRLKRELATALQERDILKNWSRRAGASCG